MSPAQAAALISYINRTSALVPGGLPTTMTEASALLSLFPQIEAVARGDLECSFRPVKRAPEPANDIQSVNASRPINDNEQAPVTD